MESGIPTSGIVILNEDAAAKPATGQTVKAYAEQLGIKLPVLADSSYQTYAMTPWDGAQRPGKCALAPDMTILECYAGDDDVSGYEAIQAHAAAQM
jgi:hypothetical protein